MPDHAKQWGPDGASVKEEVRKLRYLPLSAEIRTKYIYNSLMYTAVSHAVETVTGIELGTFLRERVWGPLGMVRTYWALREVSEGGSEGKLARGYAWDDGKGEYVGLEYPEYSGISGAGAMISNVLDYAKWLRCMTSRSAPLSARGHEELVRARSLSYEGPTNPFPGPHLYALGWRVDMYRGEQIIWHTGGMLGYGTLMMYLPTRQWGVVIVGNTTITSNMMQTVLYMHLLDEVLETPVVERVDWVEVLKGRWEARRAGLAGARERLYPNLPTPAARSAFGVEAYAGKYWHAAYLGMNLVVGDDGKGLVADRLYMEVGMMVHLEHVSGEFWLATLKMRHQDPRDYEVVKAEFRLGPEGVRAVGVDLEPEMDGQLIWFQKVD
jgi:CubicO group peptidase (beta-lactamase class C family)